MSATTWALFCSGVTGSSSKKPSSKSGRSRTSAAGSREASGFSAALAAVSWASCSFSSAISWSLAARAASSWSSLAVLTGASSFSPAKSSWAA
nr:hypothetical protein [Lactobacillus delbrueckii]